MEKLAVGGEAGGAGGAYSYNALKRLDNIWSNICTQPKGITKQLLPILINQEDESLQKHVACRTTGNTANSFKGLWPFSRLWYGE